VEIDRIPMIKFKIGIFASELRIGKTSNGNDPEIRISPHIWAENENGRKRLKKRTLK